MDGARVSVVMPVRNGAAHIDEAIASVLSQTVASLELIVVDNGSSDETPAVVARWAEDDHRVVAIEVGDIGLVGALNVGMGRARAPFVARMDADDIAEPARFERQLAYLESSPEVAVVGTGYRYIDADDTPTGRRRTEAGPERVRAAVWFGNPIAHPTVMFAVERIDPPPRYASGHPDAEDLELWLRLLRTYQLDNLTEPLLRYRQHPTSVTALAPHSGRRPAIDLLVREAPWPASLTRWIAERTYNAGQAGVGLAPLFSAIVLLNAANMVRPHARRRALVRRSLAALLLTVRGRGHARRAGRASTGVTT